VVPWQEKEQSEDDLAEKGRFNCPCHASIYDRYGQVQGGPAPRPMDLMAAWVEGDDLMVDTGEIIERSSFEASQAIPV
jgi:Rieske Fe-S protein